MRVAVLGTGDMGREHALAYAWLRETEDVELAGVVGRDVGRAQKLGDEVGALAFTDPTEVLEDGSVDAIDLAYPASLHREYAVAALERGKHVLCETPLALSLEDADAMIAAARKNNRLLMVAEVFRFVSSFKTLRNMVADGGLGAVRFAVMRHLWRPTRPRPFDVYGEPVVELMILDFDFLNWLLGIPTRVYATGVRGPSGAAEHIFATVEFEGTHAFAEGSWMMPSAYPFTATVRVRGEEGMLDLTQRIIEDDVKTDLIRYPSEGLSEPIEVEGQWPYAEECRYFIRCVQRKSRPGLLSPEDERRALRVAMAAKESIDSGEPVSLA